MDRSLFLGKGAYMNYTEGNFRGVRNANIYYQAWLPAGNVKAVLIEILR